VTGTGFQSRTEATAIDGNCKVYSQGLTLAASWQPHKRVTPTPTRGAEIAAP